MDLNPARLRQMHQTAHDRRESRAIYPEAVAIGLVWLASMVQGIQALVQALG